jgi:hypothetical protein
MLMSFHRLSAAKLITDLDTIVTIDLTSLNSLPMNTENAKAIWDPLHTLATLQGIVNRQSPRLYLFYVENEGVNIDRYWWDKYRQSGKWLAEAKVKEYQDIIELITAFKNDIQGAVIYDPLVPATSNLASTIAGVEDLIAVRYDPNPNSLYSKLIVTGPKIPVKRWLVSEDGHSLFSGKTDAYTWLIENYLVPRKCNTEFAGYYVDCYWLQSPNNNPGYGIRVNQHTLTNHDFFVSKKGFFFDLSPWQDEPATDDPSQPAGKDLETLKTILLQAYTQNGNGSKFTYIGGVQPWGFKYCNFNGIGGKHDAGETEWEYAKVISAYNAVEDADGYSYGALANASLWQHFPVKQEYPQKWVTQQELIEKGYLNENGKLTLGNKKLLIYYAGDYDGSSWMSQHTPAIWDDPKRGQVPVMWGFSPLLVERVPMALDYRRETATPNDYFVAANNGAGYMNPGMLQAPRPISGLPDANNAWAQFNAPYYKQWGLTVTGFMLDGAAPTMDNNGYEAYSTFSPNGVAAQNPSPKPIYGNMPVFKWEWDHEDRTDPKSAAEYAVAKAQRASIPFCWIRNVMKPPSFYVEAVNEIKRLNPNIELVSAPEFFELYRIYLKETEVKIGVKINDRSIQTAETMSYTVLCDEKEVKITITTPNYYTSTILVDGKQVEMPVQLNLGINKFTIQVIAPEGMLSKDFVLNIIRPLDIIRPYYDKVLAVNLNAATNGGFTFSGFQWKKNGKNISGETSAFLYLLSSPLPTDEYGVTLTTNDGQVVSSCTKQWAQLQMRSSETVLKTYPNPAQTDLTVENEDWESSSSLIMYDKNGTKMQVYPLTGAQTRINVSNCVPGIYLLQTGNQSAKIIVNK